MKILVDKCDQCGHLFENPKKYQKHLEVHAALTLMKGAFPEVEDKSYKFDNGDWCVQRDADWLTRYKKRVESIVGKIKYTPWSYGWFRCLCDGGSPFYDIACRVLNVCPICYREWGQSYYANNCIHTQEPKI